MKEQWEELIAVMNKMLGIYQAILTLSQEKHDILVAAKAHELEMVTNQEEILILQVGKLENLRISLVSQLLANCGIVEGDGSLLQLQGLATPIVAAELEKLSKEFGHIMTATAPINKLNTELIKQALNFVNYNINLLSQTAVGTTYEGQGQTRQEVPKRTTFDARV